MGRLQIILIALLTATAAILSQTDESVAQQRAVNPLQVTLQSTPGAAALPQGEMVADMPLADGTAYGFTYLGNSFIRTRITPPLTATTISALSFGAGADFDNAGSLYLLQWSGIDQLSIMDTTSGTQSVIGPTPPGAGQIWSGLAFDPTSGIWYASSTNGSNSSEFYTIDPATGTPTFIGATSVANSVTAIEIDNNGQMYAHSLVADAIFLVDKTNGQVTQLGPVGNTGVSVGHDLSFDPATGNLYLCSARAGNVSDLFQIDLSTGSGTLIGQFPSGIFPAALAIAGTFAEPLDPKPPTSFSAYSDFNTPTSMLLTWTDPSEYTGGTPLTNFTIEVFRDSVFIASVAMGTEAYNDMGLVDGQNYDYQLYAKDSVDSTSSAAIAGWIAGGAGQPLPPQNLRIGIASGGQLSAFWTNPSRNVDNTPMDDLAGINLYEDGTLLTTFTAAPGDTGQAASADFTPASGIHQYTVTAVDNETPVNESDPGNISYTPLTLPIFDDFAVTGVPDANLWINEDAEVNSLGVNPPSTPNVLSLDGFPHTSTVEADVVTVLPIDLNGMGGIGVELSFWYQPQGTGNAPEAGDSLTVDFLNDQGEWIMVRQWPGTAVVPFANEVIVLDSEDPGPGATFFFAGFQFRFRNYATPSTTTPFDHWLIDDVSMSAPATNPAIGVSPSALDFGAIATGTSVAAPLVVRNSGSSDLVVSDIFTTDNAFSVNTSSFTVAAGDSQTVTVGFSPMMAGSYSSDLGIVSNDPNQDTLIIPLSGNAIDPGVWTPLVSGTTQRLNSIFFTSANNGYAVGNQGTIIATTDGGNNWTPQTSGTTQELQSVFFADVATGYATGGNGTILKTTDAGANWSALNSGVTFPFYSINFTDPQNGYVAGLGAAIFLTTDGGASWNPPATGASFGLFEIDFGSPTTGFTVGNNGAIYKSTDSGSNWSLLQSGTPNDLLLSVNFINGNNGIACGDFGRILTTSDGGASWNTQNVGSDLLYSVFMVDASTAYIAGAPGIILKSTDGGASWASESSGTGASLFSVHYAGNSGYISGSSGTILKKTDIVVVPPAEKLLISEIVATPTSGEYIEIYNPTGGPGVVDLTHYYITDASFAGDTTFYYQIVEGGGGGGAFGDFHARFPAGASIAGGEYQTVAMNGATFLTDYGVAPTYELFDSDPAIVDMLEAFPGSINGQGGFTNGDEVAVLYHWDGQSDLVTDVDYVIYNSGSPIANNEAVDKTGVSIDGPDAGTDPSSYLPDTPIASQMSALNHAGSFSIQRIDLSEGAQVMSGGNGVGGSDETSEDLNNTFASDEAPTPNAAYPTPGLIPPRNLRAISGLDGLVPLAWGDSHPPPPVIDSLFYHDYSFEGQLGCSGVGACELAVRFTPTGYPTQLLSLEFSQQNASTSPVDLRVYLDPAGGVAGPNPPFVQSYAGLGGSDGTYTVDVSADNIMAASGDFYVGALEVGGFMGHAMDLSNQNAYIDRNWASVDGGVTFADLFTVVGGDPTLYGNLHVTAVVRSPSGIERLHGSSAAAQEAAARSRLTIEDYKQLMANRVAPQGSNVVSATENGAGSQSSYTAAELLVRKLQLMADNREVDTPLEGLNGYNIYRSDDGGTSFSQIANVDTLTMTYDDNTVTNGVTYQYYVTAQYDEGESGPSNVVSATPRAAPLSVEMLTEHNTPEYRSAVTNEGTVGMLNAFGGLPGFEWPLGAQQLFEGAVMVGVAPDQVSDGARVIVAGGQASLDEDFQYTANIDTLQDDAAGTIYQTSYDDSYHASGPQADDGPNAPLPVSIVQTTYSFTDGANSGYLIFKLEVTNTGSATLNNVLVGMYFDWDVNDFTMNTGAVFVPPVRIAGVNGGNAFEGEFAAIWDNGNPLPYIGLVPLSQSVFRSSWVLDNAQEVFPTGAAPMTEARKYGYMLDRRATDPFGDPFGPADKSLVAGLGGGVDQGTPDAGYTLAPGETATVGIAIVGGNDQQDFLDNGVAAMTKWVSMGETLVVLNEPLVGIGDDLAGVPGEFSLFQNYPNPFNPTTTIKYGLKDNVDVKLSIYNVLGQKVRTLVSGRQTAGYKEISWDGLNDQGARVSTGIYVYKLEAGDFVSTKKMILLK